MIVITAVRLTGGEGHEHISAVMWRSGATIGAVAPQGAIIDWLCGHDDGRAVVMEGKHEVRVEIVRENGKEPYLRTRANGAWSDHLLALPRF